MADIYYPEYIPVDQRRFNEMYKHLSRAENHHQMEEWALLVFMCDLNYAPEDLLVAMGRVERDRGWI